MHSIQRKPSIPLLLIVFAWFGFSPRAQAVVPPPDGGYPGQNTAEGDEALFNLTTGTDNTALGFEALFNNRIGNFNTATGSQALFSNTSGSSNTATGWLTLRYNTTGVGNTATGIHALENNTRGNFNTASGVLALFGNTTGSHNTATGLDALLNNSTGQFNTAAGTFALGGNSTGINNTATGYSALHSNLTGNGNTATGAGTLLLSSGNRNTATGVNALQFNQLGDSNLAEGAFALSKMTSGSFNIALGFDAGSNLTTGSNNIDIGAPGVPGESNTIRIGRPGPHAATFIAGIRGVSTGTANAIPVLIDSAGQLGTMSSSARFKEEIRRMDQASESIFALKPVTFHYKSDKTSTPQFGLVAEEVAKVNADLIVRGADGEIYSVRYDAVNAMLLNEFLKEHRKNEEQGATIAQQQNDIIGLKAELKEQAAHIQKVTAQLEVSKRAPQTVLNNQ